MTQDRYAYWAVIEHVQGMIGNDGEYRRQIGESCRFPDGLATRIAQDFGVIRNIQPVNSDKTSGIDHLVAELHALADTWPTTLQERAKMCCAIATRHRCAQKKHKAQQPKEDERDRKKGGDGSMAPYSGITKLMWFLRPEGWTMFDSLAQSGLSGQGTSEKNVIKFFKALEDKGFAEKRDKVRDLCEEATLSWLYAERIIDKFLLFRGSVLSGNESAYLMWAQKRGAHFLERMQHEAPSFHKKIVKLAKSVARELPNNSFETDWVIGRLKSKTKAQKQRP
jgi:hypothetical protein